MISRQKQVVCYDKLEEITMKTNSMKTLALAVGLAKTEFVIYAFEMFGRLLGMALGPAKQFLEYVYLKFLSACSECVLDRQNSFGDVFLLF